MLKYSQYLINSTYLKHILLFVNNIETNNIKIRSLSFYILSYFMEIVLQFLPTCTITTVGIELKIQVEFDFEIKGDILRIIIKTNQS